MVSVPTNGEIEAQVTAAKDAGAKWPDAFGNLLRNAERFWPAALVDCFSVKASTPAEWWVGQVETQSGSLDMIDLVATLADKLSKPGSRQVKDLRDTMRTWVRNGLKFSGVSPAPAERREPAKRRIDAYGYERAKEAMKRIGPRY